MFHLSDHKSVFKAATIVLVLLAIPISLLAQSDSTKSRLSFEGDFRFRIEQDWDSKKSDGGFRDNRTRFRYRLRAGARYTGKWYDTGFRLRTGNPAKQQDPQLTLGEGLKEFGTLPIGLETAYFHGKWKRFGFWVGKNTFPFEKSNELFWSDNVYPEGVFVRKGFQVNSVTIDSFDIRVGHFLMSASGKSLEQDSYFQGVQSYIAFGKNRFELFPSFYLFKNVSNIPDGNETFTINYAILHVGTRLQIFPQPLINIEIDYFENLQDYTPIDSIPSGFKDQKTGVVLGLGYGSLDEKGDWLFKVSFAYLQRYAAVDFMAQNDWARWDYLSSGSPDGRLTNLNGTELVAGVMVDKKTSIKMKFYRVRQLIPCGLVRETGSRIRLDLDVNF